MKYQHDLSTCTCDDYEPLRFLNASNDDRHFEDCDHLGQHTTDSEFRRWCADCGDHF